MSGTKVYLLNNRLSSRPFGSGCRAPFINKQLEESSLENLVSTVPQTPKVAPVNALRRKRERPQGRHPNTD